MNYLHVIINPCKEIIINQKVKKTKSLYHSKNIVTIPGQMDLILVLKIFFSSLKIHIPHDQFRPTSVSVSVY